MKLAHALAIAASVGAVFQTPAQASEARVELRAYVPISCSMRFRPNVQRISPDVFSLGAVEQFCNANYELTLLHPALGLGKQFRFGDRAVKAGAHMTVLQPNGRPVIGTRLLTVSGLDNGGADSLGHSLVLQVTPQAL